MFAIKIPGKAGAVSIHYETAGSALLKLREMEADGFSNVQVVDDHGAEVGADELNRLADATAAEAPSAA